MTPAQGLHSAWFADIALGTSVRPLIKDTTGGAGYTVWLNFFFGVQNTVSVSAVSYAHSIEAITASETENAYTLSLASVSYAHTVRATTLTGPSAKSQDAGSNKRYRHIYRVQIDGRPFECRSLAEALDLLAKARKFAEEHALAVARASAGRDRPKPPAVEPPRIEASRELQKAARETQDAIERIYESARRDAEIAAWFEYAERAEDEDLSLLMLM